MSGEHSPAAVLFAQLDGAPQRLEEDLSVMRSISGRNDGQVLRSEEGRVLMVFGSSLQAVSSALEMQGIFARKSYRFGVHFGETTLSSDNATGDAVDLALRIAGAAPTGAIWVSGSVMDGVKGRLPVIGVPKGFRIFKDVGRTVAIFELVQGLGPILKVAKRWKLSKVAPAWTGAFGFDRATLAEEAATQ
jgi:class 3 adenylate cyclase